jgi:hypothetical protein
MRAIFLVAVAAALGCGGSAGTGTLQLSWRFVDGRRCPDTGAVTVEVRIDDAKKPSATFACADGAEPQAVPLPDVPRDGATLHLDARSPQGAALYHGDLHLETLPASATVELYAQAAR